MHIPNAPFADSSEAGTQYGTAASAPRGRQADSRGRAPLTHKRYPAVPIEPIYFRRRSRLTPGVDPGLPRAVPRPRKHRCELGASSRRRCPLPRRPQSIAKLSRWLQRTQANHGQLRPRDAVTLVMFCRQPSIYLCQATSAWSAFTATPAMARSSRPRLLAACRPARSLPRTIGGSAAAEGAGSATGIAAAGRLGATGVETIGDSIGPLSVDGGLSDLNVNDLRCC
jgi:hypothetical protein